MSANRKLCSGVEGDSREVVKLTSSPYLRAAVPPAWTSSLLRSTVVAPIRVVLSTLPLSNDVVSKMFIVMASCNRDEVHLVQRKANKY